MLLFGILMTVSLFESCTVSAWQTTSKTESAGRPGQTRGDLIENISKRNLESWVRHLSTYPTRHTKSKYINGVADWLALRFRSFGYSDVYLHSYSRNGYKLNNVVCTKHGRSKTGRTIIVGAHFDSIMQDPEDSVSRAPGADDNGSGIAVLLEVSRILADIDTEDSIQFIAFSGEEQGYWGSTAYAEHIKAGKVDVRFFFNLDQVGYPPPDGSIIVELDTGNRAENNDSLSRSLADVVEGLAQEYITAPILFGPIHDSDYMPFEKLGYVVVGLYEAGEYPYHHESGDLPETVDYDYLSHVAKLTLVTLLNKWQEQENKH